MEIFLLIILIILSLINTIMAFRNINSNINTLKKLDEDDEFDKDEYINSLQFNTLLDQYIQPLLGKHSNEYIIEKVTNKVIKQDSKAKLIGKNKISEYLKDLLLNYNNNYIESNINNYNIENFNNLFEVSEQKESKKINNDMDISPILRNFYND